MNEVRLITLDPGHFHAALIQKEMYPNVSDRVTVYAPLGSDLIEHLNRVARFNSRAANPTAWKLEVHTGPDFMERMLRERPGNVVVLSGRNRGKIERIGASVAAGLNVLADKPWIITASDLPKLEAALDMADEKGLVAYDVMTERFAVTSILQRELVGDAGTFGAQEAGTLQNPGVDFESVHHLMKTVAGVPNIRPAWFFDVEQQGEGLADIGTHLVDLVHWILFPEQPINYRRDVEVLEARRWPTMITREEFRRVTGGSEFPDYLAPQVRGENLEYFCNGAATYAVRGIHTRYKVVWDYEAPAGSGDTHLAVFRGTRSRVEVRQGKEQRYRPELYVIPNSPALRNEVLTAMRWKVQRLQSRYPGIGIEEGAERLRVTIPDQYRVGHEAHFGQVTGKFLGYLKDRRSLPAWEKQNMLAKYYVTTRAVELSRRRAASE